MANLVSALPNSTKSAGLQRQASMFGRFMENLFKCDNVKVAVGPFCFLLIWT